MTYIKIFTNGAPAPFLQMGQGAGQGHVDFFLHITILFHQCNNINIIYQQFYYCLHFRFYT